MKSIFLLFIGFWLTMILQAQVSKTVDVTAGNLKTLLTVPELSTVTDLTLTGTMDARDFKTMRDEMPVLAVLNISEATIAAYEGTGGTSLSTNNYSADVIPQFAFYDISKDVRSHKINLKSVLIPLSTKAIGTYAFFGCGLTSFSFPSSVTAIHSFAFDDCLSLTSISIPISVISIGISAFNGCNRLTSVAIPSSIDSIQSLSFGGCIGLITVNIPSSVTYIGSKAFDGCSALQSITVPSSVTSIGENAFSGCSSLGSLTLSRGISSIGQGAFSNCTSLTGPIILPQGLKAIKGATFYSCSNLTSIVIPSSVDSIDNFAFYNCTSLNALTFPFGLVYVGPSAFSQCSGLKGTLSFPSTLATIGMNAFEYCSMVDSLIIPSTVISIGAGAFRNCNSLITIEVNHLFPLSIYALTDVFEGINKTNITLHVPFGTRERYASAYGWKEFTTIVEGTRGFLLNSTTLNFGVNGGIDNTLEVIADFPWTATVDQPWLTVKPSSGDRSHTITVTAEANGTISSKIGMITLSAAGVPSQTIHVSQASIPRKVNLTPGGLSAALTSEEKRTIDHLVITGTINSSDFGTIRDEMPLLAILDMSSATIAAYEAPLPFPYYYPENTIPSSTYDDPHNYNFWGLNNLTSVILPSSLGFIGTSMSKGHGPFAGCTGLTSIDIPASVTHIDDASFSGCTGLKSIYVWSDSLYLTICNPDPMHGPKDVFYGVDKQTCILNVPFGSYSYYAKAEQWKEFKNIIEMPEFKLSATLANLEAPQGSTATVNISSALSWTAISDQPWLTVNPSSGSGKQTITLSAQGNDSIGVRTARITFSAAGIKDQILTVYQIGATKVVILIAGGLSSAFNDPDLKVLSNLSISGTIDARDFKILRDAMPSLMVLDLSGVKVAAYTGTQGTHGANSQTYPPDAVPESAFYTETMNRGKTGLKAVTLPSSITSIGPKSFAGCSGLSFLSIPSSVTFIGDTAFVGCSHLTSIILPTAIHSIGNGTFSNCSNLRSVNIPASVTSIGRVAFSSCSSLTTVTIPSSVTSLASFAFSDCSGLITIYENSGFPPDLTNTSDVFYGVDKTTCTLTVPYGSKKLYAAAYQWQDFVHIVELPVGVKEEMENLAQFKCYPNPFTQEVAIEIQNPKHTKITVEIYNIDGQRVKSLVIGDTFEHLDLKWDGTNEQGKQVIPGVYICKMNGKSKLLVLNRP